MPKSKKVKNEAKTNGEQAVKTEGRPIIRAIKINAAILEAARAYKQKTGISFYRLGLEAISEVLKREGYLKEPVAKT